jgi:hypothetical protein
MPRYKPWTVGIVPYNMNSGPQPHNFKFIMIGLGEGRGGINSVIRD